MIALWFWAVFQEGLNPIKGTFTLMRLPAAFGAAIVPLFDPQIENQ